MTPLERPEADWMWVHVPLRGELSGVICGEVQVYHTHWYVAPGGKRAQAVRCVRWEVGACDWCGAGYKRRTRYVIPLLIGEGARLIEVGRTCYTALAMIRESGREVGAQIVFTRERPQANAPILICPLGRGHVSPEQVVDIVDHVRGLGRQALRLIDSPPPLRSSDVPAPSGDRKLEE